MKFANVSVNLTGLRAAIVQYSATTKKSPVEIVNQRTANVARWAFEGITPQDPKGKRMQIKEYMDRVIVTSVRYNKSRKKIVARGKKHHLRLKHLIAQMRAKKEGKKGLYGDEMIQAAGRLSNFAQASVGFVKSVFLPIFVGLNPHIKFKMPHSKTKDISRWPGSAGFGRVEPAKEGWDVHAKFETNTFTSKPGQISVIQYIQSRAMEAAVAKEENELRRHTAEKLKKDASRYAKVV